MLAPATLPARIRGGGFVTRSKASSLVLHEGDEPDALAHLDHANALTGEDVTEVHLAAAEADPAAAGHQDGLARQTISPWRTAYQASGCVAQRRHPSAISRNSCS